MSKKSCTPTAKPQAVPVEGANEPLKAERIEGLLAGSPGWRLTRQGKAITRIFQFPGLPSATAFAAMVTHLGAERSHPTRILQDGPTVTCTVTSRRSKGVTLGDFEMAQRISLQG